MTIPMLQDCNCLQPVTASPQRMIAGGSIPPGAQKNDFVPSGITLALPFCRYYREYTRHIYIKPAYLGGGDLITTGIMSRRVTNVFAGAVWEYTNVGAYPPTPPGDYSITRLATDGPYAAPETENYFRVVFQDSRYPALGDVGYTEWTGVTEYTEAEMLEDILPLVDYLDLATVAWGLTDYLTFGYRYDETGAIIADIPGMPNDVPCLPGITGQSIVAVRGQSNWREIDAGVCFFPSAGGGAYVSGFKSRYRFINAARQQVLGVPYASYNISRPVTHVTTGECAPEVLAWQGGSPSASYNVYDFPGTLTSCEQLSGDEIAIDIDRTSVGVIKKIIPFGTCLTPAP